MSMKTKRLSLIISISSFVQLDNNSIADFGRLEKFKFAEKNSRSYRQRLLAWYLSEIFPTNFHFFSSVSFITRLWHRMRQSTSYWCVAARKCKNKILFWRNDYSHGNLSPDVGGKISIGSIVDSLLGLSYFSLLLSGFNPFNVFCTELFSDFSSFFLALASVGVGAPYMLKQLFAIETGFELCNTNTFMREKRMEMIKKLQLSTFTTDFFFPFFWFLPFSNTKRWKACLQLLHSN